MTMNSSEAYREDRTGDRNRQMSRQSADERYGRSEADFHDGSVDLPGLSPLQRQTIEYIAEMAESLALMSRQNGLSTLSALLNVITREAESMGDRQAAA